MNELKLARPREAMQFIGGTHMVHKPRAETNAKSARALQLSEQGLSHAIIAERLGVSKLHVHELVNRARARREQSKETPQN